MPEPSAGSLRHRAQPRTVASVLHDLDAEIRSGGNELRRAVPTGFQPLDTVLGGGIRPGDMCLIGGTPGAGKTIMTLQWARNMAMNGHPVIYVCYEHDESALLGRLLALELGELPSRDDEWEMEQLRVSLHKVIGGEGSQLTELLNSEPTLRKAYERIASYADRMWLAKGSGSHTGVGELEDMVVDRISRDGRVVLFVDYLQKVSVRPEPPDEAEKVTRITEALKELALTHKIPLVAVVAADREGLRAKRLRMHHLRGSSALAYETDIALILNDKFRCVSKVHLAYDTLRAEAFKNWTIFTLEKNRGGANLVDLEFQKDFAFFRYEPIGGLVTDQLVDERIDAE